MASLTKAQREQEQARKKRVDAYKKHIAQMEEDDKLFYDNQLKREKISLEDFADSLKERSKRYADYAQQVLDVSYMTEDERYNLSREYMQKSESAYTEHIQRIKKLEREKLEAAMEASTEYVSDRNYHSDWQAAGDTPEQAFARVDKRLSENVFAGNITYDEYKEQLSSFGSEMYEDRIKNSERWLENQREMNTISAEEYISGLYRMRAYTQQYYSEGIISHHEYLDGLRQLDEKIFQERKNQHKEILKQADEEKRVIDQNANDKIAALKEAYDARISDLDEDNLNDELSYLRAQENIYKNAQTREGKERLEEIREDIDDINEKKLRMSLKEDLESKTENILNRAERKKTSVDKKAAAAAYNLGLSYDENTGYQMIRHINSAFNSVLNSQQSFSAKSQTETQGFNESLTTAMTDAYQTFSNGILLNFRSFAEGINAVKNQIFADVNSVNSLDFSKFGSSKSKTTITYNDYGDKNISSTSTGNSVLNTFKNLIAKGLKL